MKQTGKKHLDDKCRKMKLITQNKNTIYPLSTQQRERVEQCEQVVVMCLCSKGKCVKESVFTFSSE